MGNLKSSIILDLIDRVSGPARKITDSLKRIGVTQTQLNAVSKASERLRTDVGHVARETGSLATKLAVLGGAGLFVVKTQLIDTAAQFEKFRTVLETVEGSSAKAQVSMDWVSDFAAKTPYELAEVTDSFVKLRAYGLDPTNGLLRTLGDTASAMGKPIMQAVEAIADAITGENERLKEFGITAKTQGETVRYSYTDRDGNQKFKAVDKNNRKLIQSTLAAIWNEKYAGAMEKQSQTWNGMVSNLADQWTRFKVKVMNAGLFDWLKGKLGTLLATIDRMAADGSLQKWAEDFGVKLKDGFIAAYNAAEALGRVLGALGKIVSWLAGVMGGYENLVKVVAVLMAGKLLLSVGSLAFSFFSLGKVAIPVAATALKGLLPLIAQANVAGMGLIGVLGKAGLVGAVGLAGYAIGVTLNEWIAKLLELKSNGKYSGEGALGAWLYDKTTNEADWSNKQGATFAKPRPSAMAAPRPLLPATARNPVGTSRAGEMTGSLNIKIDTPPGIRATVQGMRSNNLDLAVDSGQIMRGH